MSIHSVTEYLERSASRFPDKTAFVDENRSITFQQLKQEADHISAALLSHNVKKHPVAVLLDKSASCICAFLGVVNSGNFYSPIDTEMPAARIEKIMQTLCPAFVLTDLAHRSQAELFAQGSRIMIYEEMLQHKIDVEMLKRSSDAVIDADLLYVLFTSGSTGVPKGVMISERGVIDFVEWATMRFSIDDSYVFGNQSPFYFSFSIYEIYLTLKNGATAYIIPSELFSYPADLMAYLHVHKINTLVWVPSALCMISTFRALDAPWLDELRNVWFGAEVMPVKQLNRWIAAYPSVRFVNLYGPTEVTDTCSAYEIDRSFSDTELLPIGDACRNKEILLLNEQDEEATGGETGELCIRGSGLAYGYYRDPERTQESFMQNPLNPLYPDRIYRTGDLARYNDRGELVYVSRKDFQIKHMGRRIELGEIEAAVSSVEGVESCCCLYDAKHTRILLAYTGDIEERMLADRLKELLPEYMLPGRRCRLEEMPFNLNGKIDRQRLSVLLQSDETPTGKDNRG